MLKDLIGKKVEVSVAFSVGTQGAVPVLYTGVLKEIGTEFLLLNAESCKPAMLAGTYAASKMMGGIFGDIADVNIYSKGNLFINRQFIIYILEI